MSMEHKSTAASTPKRAGGSATEAGMDWHAAVATWFAVHILVRMPVGGRFGISDQPIPESVRLETGAGLDDIELTQEDDSGLQIQCKTRANISSSKSAPLTGTVGQLARWVADEKAGPGLPNPTRNAALLAVRADSPRSLDNLESGCRAFDFGGSWAVTCSQRNQAERSALKAFEVIATRTWAAHRGDEPDSEDLVDLARIFRIARFTMVEGESDWREVSRLLGRHLFGGEADGEAPLRDLKEIMRGMISSGAPADRLGLLRALRQRGHQDVGAPRYETDITKLREVTEDHLHRLAAHGSLPLGAGVNIERDSDGPLLEAMRAGSLLVIGEPGAGKTGALVRAARAIADAGETVIFLSVDRFDGVRTGAELASELELTHRLVDSLGAMPGAGPKTLIIDALDAARGGPSETVFAALIEDVRDRLSDEWIVVASIRTFDLKNGRRFRQAFSGPPADIDFAESGLSKVRHFLVPTLSENDLAAAEKASPELGTLLESAPDALVDLLRNIFNLSLAADLLADGINPAEFRAIRTQAGLVDAYEDARLNTTQLQEAARAAAATMVSRGRLSVRKVVIGHAALDDVIQTGLLVEFGDFVTFAHNLLFDHIAGRFYLECDDAEALLFQLSGDSPTALLLAPALRFAVERLWRFDGAGRPMSWQLAAGAFSATNVDPVLSNVALRVVVENTEGVSDISGLIARVNDCSDETYLEVLLGRLARFAAMDIEAAGGITPGPATAWIRVAEALVATGNRTLLHPALVLLHPIFEHDDLEGDDLLHTFGRASRALLESSWAASPPLASISDTAIRFVGKSFVSDPPASRALLDRILREPHFSEHADQEAVWLAEQILPITRADPEFTVEIYAALYGQTITDDSTSWLGRQPSRILPLSSNRRQDFEHCRWHLGRAIGDVLAISPEHGTRALIDALIGRTANRDYSDNPKPSQVDLGTSIIELRGGDVEFNAWDEVDEGVPSRDDDLLAQYARFLRSSDFAKFSASVRAASREYATPLVWARIFGVGSERSDEMADLLWPLIERPDFFANQGTLRDAVRFVVAAWPSRDGAAQLHFERMAVDEARFSDDDELRRWYHVLGRILAPIPESALQTEKTRDLRRFLESEGLLTENEPIYRMTSGWSGRVDFEREDLRRAGVDVDASPTRDVLDASDALYATVERTCSTSSAQDLAPLWREAEALLSLIDANPGLHDRIDRAAWGHLANAVERIASSPNYEPGREGLPDLAAIFALLERLSASQYPEPDEEDG
ncbi:ATP-binding protein [Halofilum ochraceum]|uniref:ATP-binding protein n=1 Tax=Halofilum ochraceum TaxID=1611323 RepID=UPI001C2FD58C|nr:ATP-binding protein [Halofilum ochraceum]